MISSNLKNSSVSVDELGLHGRPRRALDVRGIQTIGQLASMSEKRLRSWENFGRKSLRELMVALEEFEETHPPTPEPDKKEAQEVQKRGYRYVITITVTRIAT